MNSTLLLFLLLLYTSAQCSTLHFLPQSPDRPLRLYSGPPTYRGKYDSRSSIIITSKPLGMSTDDFTTATTTSTTTSTTENPIWQRRLVTQTVENNVNPQKPRNILAIPHYTVECSSGKSCSEMIKSDRTTQKPSFKAYSQDIVDKFLKEYDGSHVDDTIESIPTTRERPISLKPVYSYDHIKMPPKNEEKSDKFDDSEAVNRLANIILDTTTDSEAGETISSDERSKSHWSLLHSQQHHHPFDDHEGWVTLEAVPWSKSKISKWYPHNNNKPWTSHSSKPHWSHHSHGHHDWELDRPSEKPDWDSLDKPHHWDKPTDWNIQKPEKPHHNHWISHDDESWTHVSKPALHKPSWNKPSNHWDIHDIITDNSPENWPPSPEKWPLDKPHNDFKPWATSLVGNLPHDSFPHKKPLYYDTNAHPPGHPENSDGEWVLLSSTKGYSAPERYKSYKRALNLNPNKHMTSTRTVRLTVLPPQNGTINTTTSHGGLLEVHKTFQTVEEDQQLFERLKRLNSSRLTYRPQAANYQNTVVKKRPTVTHLRPVALVGHINRPNSIQFTRNADSTSSNAVLAAVGAGVVPASMAVMVPMFLGKRRRKRNAQIYRTILPQWQYKYNNYLNHKNKKQGKKVKQYKKRNFIKKKRKYSYKPINKKMLY